MIVVIRTNINLHCNTAAATDAFRTTGEQLCAPGEKPRAAWLSSKQKLQECMREQLPTFHRRRARV